MPMFRKKPVVITAIQWDPDENGVSRNAWPTDWPATDWHPTRPSGGADVPWGLIIPTLEGDHRADPGDWIIRGVKGEFYPCKPDIFTATYEPA